MKHIKKPEVSPTPEAPPIEKKEREILDHETWRYLTALGSRRYHDFLPGEGRESRFLRSKAVRRLERWMKLDVEDT